MAGDIAEIIKRKAIPGAESLLRHQHERVEEKDTKEQRNR